MQQVIYFVIFIVCVSLRLAWAQHEKPSKDATVSAACLSFWKKFGAFK